MKRNMLRRSGLWALVVALSLILSACGDLDASVALAEPAEHKLTTQLVELRNCDSKTELRRPLASEVEVKDEVNIADNATAVTTGEDVKIPPKVRAKLETEIKEAYHQEYEAARANVEQTELTVPVGRIHTYTINWEQKEFSSTVSFSMEDEDYSVSYTYILCIPSVRSMREMACTA